MARDKRSRSKHDAEVRKITKDLQSKGFDVKADLSGFSKPDTIGGYRPDVTAQKGSQKKIFEVETPDSVSSARDVKQQQAFRQAAKKDSNTTFKRKITD